MLLYHPELNRTFETGNDSEDQAAVMARAGWGKTIPGEHTADPNVAADQPDDAVVYQPVVVDKAPDAKPVKAAAKKTD